MKNLINIWALCILAGITLVSCKKNKIKINTEQPYNLLLKLLLCWIQREISLASHFMKWVVRFISLNQERLPN